MRRHDVRVVVDYYYAIHGMTALLEKEKRELEGKYNGLRATSYGNPSGGGGYGRTTEDLAERAEALRVSDRIDEIGVRICVLDTDHDKIRGCLDILKGEYKKLIELRYRSGYSWAIIAARMSTTERTAKRWNDRALDRLAEALADTPMAEELVERAMRARD